MALQIGLFPPRAGLILRPRGACSAHDTRRGGRVVGQAMVIMVIGLPTVLAV